MRRHPLVLGLAAAGAVTVARWGVWEQTLAHPTGGLADPWEQVSVELTVTTPSDTQIKRAGLLLPA